MRKIVMVNGVPRISTVLPRVQPPLQVQVDALQQQIVQVAAAVDPSNMPATTPDFVTIFDNKLDQDIQK